MDELRYDPYDEEIDRDPHATWRRLRDEQPLYFNEEHGFYALSRYADVHAASLDWQTYSSARGTVLEMMDSTPLADGDGPGDGMGMMIFMDPPHHDELRRLVSRAFTPRRVAALEERMRDLCATYLGELVERGHGDFLDDFAARIPAMVIGALLGVPVDMQDQFRHWADDMMRYEPEGPSLRKRESSMALWEYMGTLVAERRSAPRDDMVSDLLAAEITREDGSSRRLDDNEVLSFFMLLEVAGSETTARLLGWMAVLLARHPDQRELLLQDRSLVPNAVEELLRYEAPSPIQARFVTRDVSWHGITVPRSSKLALLTGSAGRDEREYVDPDVFDVQRRFDRHVTFGYGIHYCLGANLARMEGIVVLDETLDRLPAWEVDESAVEMVRTTTVRGPLRVPISW